MQSVIPEQRFKRLAWCAAATVVAAAVWLAAPTGALFTIRHRSASANWEVALAFFTLMFVALYVFDGPVRKGRTWVVLGGMCHVGFAASIAAEFLCQANATFFWGSPRGDSDSLWADLFAYMSYSSRNGTIWFSAFLALVHRSLRRTVAKLKQSRGGAYEMLDQDAIVVNAAEPDCPGHPDAYDGESESRLKRLGWSTLATALGACIMLATPLRALFYYRYDKLCYFVWFGASYFSAMLVVMYCSGRFARSAGVSSVIITYSLAGLAIRTSSYLLLEFQSMYESAWSSFSVGWALELFVFLWLVSILNASFVVAVIIAILYKYLPRLSGWVGALRRRAG